MKADEYFDKKADDYSKDRSKGFLGGIVNKEKEFVLRFLDVKKGETVLDAGCGSGDFSLLVKQRGGVPFGVDISKNMIEVLKKNGFDGCVADLESLNLNKKFDKIVCGGAIEFTTDQVRVFKNLRDHLNENGFIVLIYPRKGIGGYLYRIFHLIHGLNIKLFSPKDLKKIFDVSDLKIDDIRKTDFICGVVKISRK